MYKVLISLVIGLSALIAQPMPHNQCEMQCGNNMTVKPDCPMQIGKDMPEALDFMCKQDPKEMVETIRIYKMTEELNLTQDQSTKFFPKLKELRLAKEEFRETRLKIADEMEQYLKDPDKFTKEIKVLVGALEANEQKLRDIENRVKKEIGNILTPEQQAKFLLFQMQFNKQMREMVDKAKDFKKDGQEDKPKRWRIY